MTTAPPTITAPQRRLPRPWSAALALAVMTAIAAPRAAAAESPAAQEEPLSSAEAVKHSVLAHPAFWLIPDRQGCVATTTRGLGTAPVAAAVNWESNVWVCSFTKEFGVARCQSLSHVDVKSRANATFADLAFVVRPDRDPTWASTFGGLTETFVSQHESLATNARREYLLQTDTFKPDPATAIHTVCSGRWEPMSAHDLAELAKKSRRPPASPSRTNGR